MLSDESLGLQEDRAASSELYVSMLPGASHLVRCPRRHASTRPRALVQGSAVLFYLNPDYAQVLLLHRSQVKSLPALCPAGSVLSRVSWRSFFKSRILMHSSHYSHHSSHSSQSSGYRDDERTWFIPGFGISRHILYQHIRPYLGPSASVRPFTYGGREGYLLTAAGNGLTPVGLSCNTLVRRRDASESLQFSPVAWSGNGCDGSPGGSASLRSPVSVDSPISISCHTY